MARRPFPRGGIRTRLPVLLRSRASDEFSPTEISGLALWLDASDGATLFQNSDGTVPATATSDPVGYWADKSGNGRHAVQATAGSRPTISATAQNGRRQLAFDGSNDTMTTTSFSLNQPYIAFLVAKLTSASGAQNIIDSSESGRAGMGYNSTVGWAGFAGANLFGGTVDTSPHVLTYKYNTTASSISVDGAPVATGSIGLQGFTGLRISGFTSTVALFNGSLAEIVLVGGSPADTVVRRVERYLAAKYGITLAPQVANADAQNWIDRVYQNGGTVSSATAQAVDTFCSAIDSAGIRDRFYRMGIFAGSNLNAALVPLYRGPSLGGTQYGGTTDTNNAFVGVGTDYAETGATGGLAGNGTSKYLNTGLNASSVGTEGHAAIYHRASIANAGASMLRVSDGASHIFGLDYSTGVANMRGFWGSTGTVAFGSTSGGLHTVTRRSATDLEYYRNGGSVGTQATSVTPTAPAQPFYVFASNQAGTPGIYSAANLQAYSIGLSMTASQVVAYNTAMNTFQTALSRA